MARADRLLSLLHALRTLPAPVTAARLAEATEVSLRSIYRDVASLRVAGARIEGEAGYGYALSEDPALPPQSFTRLEIEALLMGLAEVRQSGDSQLARAAEAVGAKIVATLPERQAREAAHAVLTVRRGRPRVVPERDLSVIREAAWEERALDLAYRDEAGSETTRRVWPLLIAYFDEVLMLAAWCTLRQDFRRFRLDRIGAVAPTAESFRPRRAGLLREFVAGMEGQSPSATTAGDAIMRQPEADR